jgi:hypothetical protein
MRPNLKDVLALLDAVKEGETFGLVVDQKQWSCWAGGDFVMGRDRRKTVRKALDAAEQKLVEKRKESNEKDRINETES